MKLTLSGLTIYRLKVVAGLALIALAGLLLLFWKYEYKFAPIAALGALGLGLGTPKYKGDPEALKRAQQKFSPSTVKLLNFAIIALMAAVLIFGLIYAVMH